jgi:hypothetical protein
MRAGELADLDADAVVRIGAGHWLRIPLGKLRNDRYLPLHPERPGPPPTSSTSAATSGWSPTIAARWTGTSSPASCTGPAAPPGFPACTHTGRAADSASSIRDSATLSAWKLTYLFVLLFRSPG